MPGSSISSLLAFRSGLAPAIRRWCTCQEVVARAVERAVQALAVAYAELADTLIEEIEAAS